MLLVHDGFRMPSLPLCDTLDDTDACCPSSRAGDPPAPAAPAWGAAGGGQHMVPPQGQQPPQGEVPAGNAVPAPAPQVSVTSSGPRNNQANGDGYHNQVGSSG